MDSLKTKLPEGHGCVGFRSSAQPTPIIYLDQILARPVQGVLRTVTLKYKNETKEIDIYTKWGRKLGFDRDVRPQIEDAINTGKSVKLFFGVERREGNPLEQVLVARYSHRVLVSFNRGLGNHGKRSQSPSRPPAPTVDQ